jgi:type II secretory pathway predicted ATPase ExeA
MLCRMLMERLPENVETVYIANPLLLRDDILFAIADELQLALQQDRNSALMRALQAHLVKLYGEGKQVVLLVDEAHAMPADTLEEIRLLSNLESQRHKLMQIVLFGQPELDEILDRTEMRQLKDRITHHFSLEPLVRSDVAAYIDFRMRAAGYRGPNLFSEESTRLIARASGGLTRRINILADKALLAAYAANRHEVGIDEVNAAIRDAKLKSQQQRIVPWLAGAAGAAAILAAAGALVWQHSHAPTSAAQVPPPAAATHGDDSHADSAVPAPLPAPRAAPAPGAQAAAPAANATAADDRLGPLTRLQIEKTVQWLATAPPDRWFLQLLTSDVDNALEVERLVAGVTATAAGEQLRVYRAMVDGTQRLGVIYGDYASSAQARLALRELPPSLRRPGAYPRQVRRLQ